MSLDKLSTELDAKIASHLMSHTRSLSALSKVSKYYRSVAEPCLYKKVKFNDMESWHLWCLLRTIIDRDEIALYLKSLTFYDIMSRQHRKMADPDLYKLQNDEMMRKEIWARSGLIMGHINNSLLPFTKSAAAAELAYEWTGNLFSMRWNESLAALALILSRNLEAIKLRVEFSRHDVVCGLLTLPWSGTKPPFQKLKVLSIKNPQDSWQLGSSSMLLSLEDLSIKLRRRDGVITEFSTLVSLLPSHANPALTTLRLRGNDLTPADLQMVATSPISTDLRRLRLTDYSGRLRDYGPKWNFDSFVTVLDIYFPNLKELHWKGSWPLEECSEPPNFRNLHKLRSLRLVYKALAPEQDKVPRALVQPHRVFPSKLETLIIERIDVKELNAICENLQSAVKEAEAGIAMISTTINTLLSEFSLTRFDLDIWPHDRPELRATTLVFLRQVADEMFRLGVVMKVHFMPRWWRHERHYTLMVKKGFAAQPFDSSDEGR